MSALYSSVQEFDDMAALWSLENHSPEWPLYKSDEALLAVRNTAANLDGKISISHFIIAFDSLVASGGIKKLRSQRPLVDVHELTADEYREIPPPRTGALYR